MPVIGLLLIALLLAFMVETLVEFLFADVFGFIYERYPFLARIQAKKFIAIGISIAYALFYQLDFLYLMGVFLEIDWQPLASVKIHGMIISGIAVGMGSTYLHDMIRKFFVKPSSPQELPQPQRQHTFYYPDTID